MMPMLKFIKPDTSKIYHGARRVISGVQIEGEHILWKLDPSIVVRSRQKTGVNSW